jgi:hypothetical protein
MVGWDIAAATSEVFWLLPESHPVGSTWLLGDVGLQTSRTSFDHSGLKPFWVCRLIAPDIEFWCTEAIMIECRSDVSPMGDAMIDYRHEDQACLIIEFPSVAFFMHTLSCRNVLEGVQ